MSVNQIVVLGGGFAGLWSALGAARKLDELGLGPEAAEVTLVNRDGYHCIRVRNYEADLSAVRVPLDDVLDPVGVRRLEGEVAGIDLAQQTVTVTIANGQRTLHYDRLVFTLGSQLLRPNVPGLAEHAFDVDTYNGAARLNSHLQSLLSGPATAGQWTVVVVGAGLTGIEAATEMIGKLGALPAGANASRSFRVILADREPRLGSDMGDSAAGHRESARRAGDRDAVGSRDRRDRACRADAQVGRGDSRGHRGLVRRHARQPSDAPLPGRARPLRPHPGRYVHAGQGCGQRVRRRRRGLGHDGRPSRVGHVLSARTAHGAVRRKQCRLRPVRPADAAAAHCLGCDRAGSRVVGALYTEGWDRHVVTKGEAAKKTKQVINCQRIYPPLTGNRQEILAAAAPVVQAPPKTYHERHSQRLHARPPRRPRARRGRKLDLAAGLQIGR